MSTAVPFGNSGNASGPGGLNGFFGGSGDASAGDWLVFGVCTAAPGTPAFTTNLGAAGVSLIASDSTGDFAAAWYVMQCNGGENTINLVLGVELAFAGFLVRGASQPTAYLIGEGALVWNGSHMRYTAPAMLEDNETFLGIQMCAVAPDASDIVTPPGSTQQTLQFGTDVGVFAAINTDETTLASQLLTYSVDPEIDCFVAFIGFADINPGALHGTGTFLLGASADLESSSPPALASRARVAAGGLGVLTAPAPFPPYPVVPDLTGQLNCGIYDVFIFTRGLREIVGRTPFNTLEWSRTLDDTSTAQVTINGVSNTGSLANCCALLGSVQPYEHEIGIYRNGQRVWSGPVTDIQFPSETVIIEAEDLSAWLKLREIHYNHNDVQQDLADIWVGYVTDAMSVENSAGLFATVLALTGVLADRLYTPDMGTVAADAISELARTGLDWTCTDRRMTGGPVPPQPAPYINAAAIPTLIDESFNPPPTVDRNGNLMGNCWFVGGSGQGPGGNAIFGEYGPAFPLTDDHLAQPAAPDYASIEAQYGRIERRVNETKILDQPSIDQNAATRYDLTKRPVDVISDGSLLPTAGIDISQLTAGSVQNIHLARACVQIGAPYRLKALHVTANSDGSESVTGAWEPIGSTAAHEDLG